MNKNHLKMGLDIEDYKKVRLAMSGGARTIEDIRKSTDIFIRDEDYESNIQKVLESACICKNISIQQIVEAVKKGADSLEKVKEVTGANTECGRCLELIQNIIDNKR